MPQIIHSISIIITIALSFLFSKSNLAQYDLQISALLFIILFIGKKLVGNSKSRFLESIIFTLIVLIIVNSTGGVNSPFFFLIYFLFFSLSLLLESIISVIATLTLVIFFLLTTPPNQELISLLPILSLAFLTPFAMLVGEEHKKNLEFKIQNSKLTNALINTKEETFLFLSLMLKNHLKSIKYAIENFMGDHELHEIKKHSREIEKLIEKFENSN